MGVFDRINGVLFGRPGGTMDPTRFVEFDDVLTEVIAGEFGRPDLPIVTQMDFGHTDPMFVIPYGVMAELDCSRNKFSILESAVVD